MLIIPCFFKKNNTNNKDKKKLINSKKRFNIFKLVIIKVWKTPTLPEHIIKFNNKIIIRIFRVVGGITLVLTLSQKLFTLNEYLIYLGLVINFLFFVYHSVLNYFRIKHILYLMKSEELDIKNSPVNRIASIFTRGIVCLKGACEGGIYVGTVLGTGIAYDWALESAGKDKVFSPLVGNFIRQISGSPLSEEQIQQLEELKRMKKNMDVKLTLLKELKNVSEANKEVSSLLNNIEIQEGILSKEEKDLLLKAFKEERDTLISNSLEIKQKINMEKMLENFKNK